VARTRDAKDVHEAFSTFLDEHWDPDMSVAAWWACLAEHRWGALTWPEQWYGRGLSGEMAKRIADERERHGVPGGPGGLGILLAGPTIIAHGTDEQKSLFLPSIIDGQSGWCQLFSEPAAGSDLASLRTRAVLDGDEWVITGQKVWSSGANVADMGMLLARTDGNVPKHEGITYFAVDMHQPGIEVRPIKEMTGRARFSEVFFDDARVPAGNAIGGVNAGWKVAQTTLSNERSGLGGGNDAVGGAPAGQGAGMLGRRAGELAGHRVVAGTSAVFATRGVRLLVEVARAQGCSDDPKIRQGLARLHTFEQISRYTAMRAKAAVQSGRSPGPEVSTQKLNMSRMVRQSRDLGMAILGAHGTLTGSESVSSGRIQELFLMSPAPSIYGGTDQIQRNVIGERVLGLPREPQPDRGLPFRDLPG
jgi:alkylation response protein AidB-like acyl-CoA dehydrogenase